MARSLRKKWEGKRKFLIETSGGIEEGNLKERAVNGTSPAIMPSQCTDRDPLLWDIPVR